MIRKLIVGVVALAAFLSGCSVPEGSETKVSTTSSPDAIATSTDSSSVSSEPSTISGVAESSFASYGDPDHLQYVEDQVLAAAESELVSDDYEIQDVTASYVSQEYLDEQAYNSQENIYFGYTLSEIESQFQGTSYVFNLGSDGQTEVRTRESYDDSFEQITRNAATGSGVILICVTVSLLAGPAGASTVTTIFAVSAKTGAVSAISKAGTSGLVRGALTAIETGDLDAAMKDAAVAASEGFAKGAIFGVIKGAFGKGVPLRSGSNPNVPTERDSEIYVLRKSGGSELKAYLNGQEVPYGSAGSARPDLVVPIGNGLNAIEVMNYDLDNGFPLMLETLRTQIGDWNQDLPEDMEKRIMLDVRGRGYTEEFVNERIEVLEREFPGVDVEAIRG